MGGEPSRGFSGYTWNVGVHYLLKSYLNTKKDFLKRFTPQSRIECLSSGKGRRGRCEAMGVTQERAGLGVGGGWLSPCTPKAQEVEVPGR